ncbi:hypothetical protein PHYPO_G00215910 [Pangasianodon hypophthalmus]|uniref:5'-3' exonuclease PLD3 n=1 Tax=Pangasianodon hypophthalmus TaxID=310915 RepID=A0A5N5P5F5_PANHP|nr:hypothetical protein PHYPO_G00215910 [Pangasianodon hypophthalmus]
MSTSMKSGIAYEKMADVESSRGESLLKSQKYYRCILIITCLTAVLLMMFSFQTLLIPSILTSGLKKNAPITHTCSDTCRLVLLESIPVGVEFNSSVGHPSIYQAWRSLLSEAQSSLDIASFYWTLTNEDTHTHEPTAKLGEEIMQELVEISGKISVRIAVNAPQDSRPQRDIQMLIDAGADVRDVNMRDLTSGVLHTKFWVVDKKHIYIGSANMDWRSLTQVKELGAVVYDCKCLADDLGKYLKPIGSSVRARRYLLPGPANTLQPLTKTHQCSCKSTDQTLEFTCRVLLHLCVLRAELQIFRPL